MNSYTIVLKNEKLGSYNKLGLLILLIHLLYFVNYFLKVISDVNFIALAAGIAISFLGLVLNAVSAFRNNKLLVHFFIVFVLLAVTWSQLDNYWLFIALLALAFLDFTVRKKPAVQFFADRIELPSFPKRTVQWNELNNVILKDRILTLDFKNDRLIQSEIQEESYTVDEGHFNLFCKLHLQNKN